MGCPRGTSPPPSPMDSSPPSEVDYAEHITALNNIDIKVYTPTSNPTYGKSTTTFNFLHLAPQTPHIEEGKRDY